MQSYTDYTIKRTKALNILPPSSNLRRSGVFRTDYNCVEKTLLPLIIKHWDSIWVTKYVLTKVACPFPMHLPLHGCMHVFLLGKTRKRCTIKMVGSTLNPGCFVFVDNFWILGCLIFGDGGSNEFVTLYRKKNRIQLWLSYLRVFSES